MPVSSKATVRATGVVVLPNKKSCASGEQFWLRPMGGTGEDPFLRISGHGIGWELRAYLEEPVTVSGVLRKTRSGRDLLYVKSYGPP